MTKLRARGALSREAAGEGTDFVVPLMSMTGLLRIASTVKQSTTVSISPLSSAQQ
jgi:hypothetical protein